MTAMVALVVASVTMAADLTDVSSYAAPQLVAEINTAIGEADTRLDTLEAGTVAGQSSLTLSNSANAGAVTISMQSDKGDDAGDKFAIVAQDGGTLAIQSDASVKGTLATKASVSSAGLVTCVGVTSTAGVTGTTIGFSATQYFAILNTTQLVFIAGSVTNVIDADITTP
jgi:hypothetical protein